MHPHTDTDRKKERKSEVICILVWLSVTFQAHWVLSVSWKEVECAHFAQSIYSLVNLTCECGCIIALASRYWIWVWVHALFSVQWLSVHVLDLTSKIKRTPDLKTHERTRRTTRGNLDFCLPWNSQLYEHTKTPHLDLKQTHSAISVFDISGVSTTTVGLLHTQNGTTRMVSVFDRETERKMPGWKKKELVPQIPTDDSTQWQFWILNWQIVLQGLVQLERTSTL